MWISGASHYVKVIWQFACHGILNAKTCHFRGRGDNCVGKNDADVGFADSKGAETH